MPKRPPYIDLRTRKDFPTPIRFFVEGRPAPQPRPRACKRPGGFGQWNPKYRKLASGETVAAAWVMWRNDVFAEALRHRPGRPLVGPVRIDIDFLFPRPKKMRGSVAIPTWRATQRRDDRDNLDKLVLDALTEAGMVVDDGIVVDGRIRKMYTADGWKTGALITIQAIETNPDLPSDFHTGFYRYVTKGPVESPEQE